MDTAWQWINGTSADPFDVIPGSNLGAAPYALEFRECAVFLVGDVVLTHSVIKCVAPTVATVNHCFGVANIYGRWLLEHMSRSRELFHVIVASMKGARDVFSGYEVSKDLMVHKAAALSLLRARIASCKTEVDDTTILTMLLLALLEDAMGDRDAYRIHRAQVARLTPLRSVENGNTSGDQFHAIVRQYSDPPAEADCPC
jgi:hypothetical protein